MTASIIQLLDIQSFVCPQSIERCNCQEIGMSEQVDEREVYELS